MPVKRLIILYVNINVCIHILVENITDRYARYVSFSLVTRAGLEFRVYVHALNVHPLATRFSRSIYLQHDR